MLREKTRVALGLDGIYSLVSTDDLADTGYTSKVRLNIQIDDLTQIKGKTIRIKNGSKIVKEVIVFQCCQLKTSGRYL